MTRRAQGYWRHRRALCAGVVCATLWSAAVANPDVPGAASALERAQHLLDEGKVDAAKTLLDEAMQVPAQHFSAYGKLVESALDARDHAQIQALFGAHRAYPFSQPAQFQHRIQYYELRPLRQVYNQAVQAAQSPRQEEAEQGFSQLLGDEAFHRQAAGWLFRLAMRQKDFARAKFIAGLAGDYADDPATSPNVLGACAAQRDGDRATALALLDKELKRRGADAGSAEKKRDAQQAVYLAMIRLHVEIDQCFLNAFKNPNEARPLFPDLPDRVLAYLAR